MWKNIPVFLKFVREADALNRPSELALARCGRWGRNLDMAVRTSRTQMSSGSGYQERAFAGNCPVHFAVRADLGSQAPSSQAPRIVLVVLSSYSLPQIQQ